MVELDRETDAEAVMRARSGDLVAVAHLDVLSDPHETLGRVLLGDAGGLQQEHERARRSRP
jgi:hypothetical protein